MMEIEHIVYHESDSSLHAFSSSVTVCYTGNLTENVLYVQITEANKETIYYHGTKLAKNKRAKFATK